MKRKEFNDLKTKDTKTLRKLISDKRFEISKKRMDIFEGKEKNLKLLTNLRREIAKILTLIKEKEISERLEGGRK
jgi:ribosomal protein L29